LQQSRPGAQHWLPQQKSVDPHDCPSHGAAAHSSAQ